MVVELHDSEVSEMTQYDLLPELYQEYRDADEVGRAGLRQQVAEFVAVARLAAGMGVPFCIEPSAYYRSPHSVLHETGHWAVKPDSYLQVYRALSARDFEVVRARAVIIEAPFGDDEVIEGLMTYLGANDRIPDWDLPDGADPTPNEKANRVWCRHALACLGMRDPVEIGRSVEYQTQGTGDRVIAKAASFRTWAPSSALVPRAWEELDAFGFDPSKGEFRPPQNSLELPYPKPTSVEELIENVVVMQARYSDRLWVVPEQMVDWRKQIQWKYGDYLGGLN